jgi:hypothetical protein
VLVDTTLVALQVSDTIVVGSLTNNGRGGLQLLNKQGGHGCELMARVAAWHITVAVPTTTLVWYWRKPNSSYNKIMVRS